MIDRSELLSKIRARYLYPRVNRVEPEFISFEEDTASIDDLMRLCEAELCSMSNPHNSALLYVIGITDEYDFTKGVDTLGGSMADVDTDFDTQDFHKLTEWLVKHYGRESVANILAIQKFKPRGIARKYYSVTAPQDELLLSQHLRDQEEVLKAIPDALFGKEPTLQECIDGNKKKGFPAHPELLDPKFKGFLEVAHKLEGMVSTFGIHACGYAITDFPISDVVPLWARKTTDEYSGNEELRWITQATMEELEEHGIIKFDFLRIENLSIIKECTKLIRERHGIDIDPYSIQDGDEKAYQLICSGKVAGIFQFEASDTTRKYAMLMKPSSIENLSDISALVRPGSLQAGMADDYIKNKERNRPPADMPDLIAEELKDCYWVMAYQEQLIRLVNKVAGFSLAEADAVRKAVG